MLKKCKNISKKLLIVFMIVTALLPSLFSGMSYAADDTVYLTVERAGNYVANFAINFYENWSRVKLEPINLTKNQYDVRGEIKTVYDDTATENINPDDAEYKISNTSWLNFVYKQALSFPSGKYPIQTGGAVNNRWFEKLDTLKTAKTEDVYKLVNQGDIIPGDILVATKDDGVTKEYLLYVGGARIIYATPELAVDDLGALKYDYLQYYLKGIEEELKEKYRKSPDEKYEDIEIPITYGILEIHRIGGASMKDEFFTNIRESDTNLLFNNKGYFSPKVEYKGIPSKMVYEGSTNLSFFRWLFDMLIQLIKFLLNLIAFVIRMVFVGWISVIESLIQSAVLSVGGSAETKGSAIDKATGLRAFISIEDRVTVEGLFFNEVPIVDANFFNYTTAGKYSLLDSSGNVDTTNVIYQLRYNLAGIYYIIRNLSIAILLFILIYLGIRIALSAIPEKKANYKILLKDWVVAFLLVLSVHFIMYGVLFINEKIIDICRAFSTHIGTNMVDGMGEVTIYEAIRTKAYAFGFHEGNVGMIFYAVMVYLLIRYLIIYFKRYVTIYILALSGSFMGVKYAIDKIQGKKTTSFGKWLKEYSFNVLLQSVHAFLYVIFMGVALSLAELSFAGIVYSFIILNTMINADKIFMKIFGIDRASSLADVNRMESPLSVVTRAFPMYFFMKRTASVVKRVAIDDMGLFAKTRFALTGKVAVGNGLFARARMGQTGKDNDKDAKKELLKQQYEKIGAYYREKDEKWADWIERHKDGRFSKLPIAILNARMNSTAHRTGRLMGNHISADTNKALVANLAKIRKLDYQRFTRPISNAFNIGYGGILTGATIGQLSSNPTGAIATGFMAKSKFDKSRRKNKYSQYGDEIFKQESDAYDEQISTLKKNYQSSESFYKDFIKSYKSDDWYGDLSAIEGDNDRDAELLFRELYRKAKNEKDDDRKEQIEQLEYYRKEYRRNRLAYEMASETDFNRFIANRDMKNKEIKDAKSSEKARKNIGEFEKFVKEEEHLNELMKELKEQTEKYAEEMGMTNKEAQAEVQAQLNDTIKQTKGVYVGTGTIKASIAEYLHKKEESKVKSEDLDGIIDAIEARFNEIKSRNGRKRIEFTTDERERLKEEIINGAGGASKMNDGVSRKDIAASIALALADGQILRPKKFEDKNTQDKTDIEKAIIAKQEEISQAYRRIRALNQASSIKNKSSLAPEGKVHKNARKKSKEV